MSDTEASTSENMETPASQDVTSLIEALRDAQRERRSARNWMTVLMAVVILVFIFLGVNSFQNFDEDEFETLAAMLSDEAEYLLPQFQAQLEDAANEVLPAYQNAFTDVFSRDEEKYQQILADEYVKLDLYSKKTWPKIEASIAQLVTDQELTMQRELSRYINEEQLAAMTQRYNAELDNYLERYFNDRFGPNLIIAEGMIDKLRVIAETETDMPPADTQFIVGMFIELLGIEMQLASEGEKIQIFED